MPAVAPPPPAAATPPPNKAGAPPRPPTKKKGGGGGKKFLFFVFVLLAGAAAAVWYYPKQVEKYTGWRVPQFVQKWAAQGKQGGKAQTPVAAKPAKAVSPPAATTTTDNNNAANAANAARAAAQTAQQAQAEAKAASAAATRAETTARRALAAAQEASAIKQSGGADLLNLRLRLINAELRLDGDTARAAAALRRLAIQTPAATAAGNWLQEAARLEKTISRQDLLAAINNLRLAAGAEAEPAAAGWLQKLQKLFAVRRVARMGGLAAKQLEELRLLALAGQNNLYWQTLERLTQDAALNAEQRQGFLALWRRGKPDHALRLPELQAATEGGQ